MTSKNPLLKLEDEVEDLIVLDAAQTFDSHLWRNNSGALETPEGFMRFGLGNISKKVNEYLKSSDEIGGTPIKITPEMVGKTIFVFTSVECKHEGWTYSGTEREVAQKNWIDLIIRRGGIAGFASSVDQYRKLVNDYLSSLRNRSN